MPETESSTLIYLYAVVPADAPDPGSEVAGLDGGVVRLLRVGPLAAVVGDVPSDAYADDALNARLGELAWVGERGIAHERVLDWFAERGPVVPLSLFSLHRDEERVVERLRAEEERLVPLLEGLRGRREWGIKLWRDEQAVAAHVDTLSPVLQALTREIESASPGRRFLLEKKRDAARGEELRSLSKRLAHRVYQLLGEAAERSATVPLPVAPPEGARTLLLHAAFLVPEDRFPGFQRRVGEVAREVRGVGFEVEFTGPWPPYHFAAADGP